MKSAAALCWLAAVCILTAGIAVRAQEDPDKPEPIRFRRYFIPEDQKAELTRGYVPVRREQFEEWLEEAERMQGLAAPRAHITSAEYVARLEDGELRDGFALLDFQNNSRQPISAVLHPLTIALGDAIWFDSDRREVVWGSGRDGRHRVIVPGTGRMLVPWSLRGQRAENGGAKFQLQLPSAPLNRLILALPNGWVPLADGTVVSPWRGDANVWRDYPAAGKFLEAIGEHDALWSIEFAGAGNISLSLGGGAVVASDRALTTSQQTARYSLFPSRLELKNEINLNVHRHAISSLTVAADSGLQLIEARLGEQSIEWINEPQRDGSGELYHLQFPQPILGANFTLSLTSHADLLTGRSWTIPRLHLMDVLWHEERVELSTHETLVLRELDPHNCVQTRRSDLPDGGESHEFQCYTAAHQLQVFIAVRQPELRAEAGVLVRMDREVITARWVADIKATWGDQFRLQARIAKPWSVTHVELVPATALDSAAGSWRFEEGLLDIPLREPITTSRPMRVVIEARRRTPPERIGLSGEQLQFLQFVDIPPPQVLYRLQASTQQQIKLVNDLRLQRIDPQTLTPEDVSRLGGATDDFVLRGDSVRSSTALLVQDVPGYTAEMQVQVNVRRDAITESYVVRCTAESLPIQQVQVHLSQKRAAPLEWHLGDSNELLAARLISDDERLDGIEEGELWEIDLPSQRNAVFDIRAQRKITTDQPLVVSLGSVPQATSESGQLVVRSYEPIRWENGGLETLPLPFNHGASEKDDLRGTFRYQPSQKDQFVIERVNDPASARAWVAMAQYTTRIFADGQGVHEAVFRLQNTGRDRMEIRIPVGITVLGIDVDGRPVSPGAATRPELSIPIPANQGYPTIRLRYVTNMHHLSWGGRVAAPVPRASLPVLNAEWICLFPSDYRVWSGTLWGDASQEPQWPLMRRLFGPLTGISADDQELGFSRSEQHQMEAFLRRLGDIASAPNATWGHMAAVDNSATDPLGKRVFVDEFALAARGLSPGSPLEVVDDPDSLRRALALLNAADLAVVIRERTALITTRRAIRSWSDCLVPGNFAAVYGVRRGLWLDELLSNPDFGSATGLVPIQKWRTDPTQIFPWQYDPPFAASDNADAGWSAVRIPLAGATLPSEVSLSLIRITSVQQWAWSVYLAAVACGGWLCVRRKSRLILLVALSVAVALLLPVPLVPIGTSLLLGTLTAVAVLTIVPPVRALTMPPVAGQIALGSAALGCILLTAWLVRAQEGSTPTAGETAPAATKQTEELRVLIPMTDEGTSTGEYWYVSRPLHELLLDRFESMGNGGGWLLRSAQYTMPHNDARVPEIAVRLKIETFAANQIVELPFNKLEVQLIDARLNNEPANIRFNAAGAAVLLTVPRQGSCDVTMSLGARRVRDSEIDFAVPPVANAVLDVAASELLDAASARGTTQKDGDRQSIALGPAPRIVIRGGLEPARRTQAVQLDERLWLRIRPNSVVLDALWTFEIAQGRLDKVTVIADPRLRLRPLADGQPVDGEPQIEQSDYQRITFPLKPSAGSRFTLQASFFVRDSAGIGQQRLPKLELLNVHYDQRLFAISSAPNIQLTDIQVEDAVEVAVDQFMQHWPSATDEPSAAYQVSDNKPGGDTRWLAISRFQAPVTTADQQLRLRAGAEHIELDFSAALATSGGPVFQRRLVIPPDFQPASVIVTNGDKSSSVRYAVTQENELTVFLAEPAAAAQRIFVMGTLPLSRGQLTTFPLIRVLDANVSSMRVEAFRLSDVAKLELNNLENWSAQDQVPPESIQISDPVRFVGAWTVPEFQLENSAATLRVLPNRVRSDGNLVTQLSRNASGWSAEVEYHLQVEEGVVDIVRLDVPTDWEEPFELQPEFPFELRPVPGTTRRQLLIRPDTAIDKEFSVRIRGKLAGTGDRIRRAPDIVPLDADSWQRYLVVPTRLETQQIVWSTSGLVARTLPPSFQMAQDVHDGVETYQILGSQFHAAVQRIERVAGLPQVRLADVNVYWSAGHRYAGVVAFDLEPAGLTQCTIRAPSQILVHAIALDGNPTPVEKIVGGEYRVTLGPPQLPQRLEVAFSGVAETPRDSRSVRLQTPWINELPVARTLWTISSPASLGAAIRPLGENSTAAQLELARLDSAAKIVETAFELATETGMAQAQQWLERWSTRVADAQVRFEQLNFEDGSTTSASIEDRFKALEELWRTEKNRLGADTASSLFSGKSAAPVDDILRAWRAAARRGSVDVHCSLPGSAPLLRLTIPKAGSDWLLRVCLALAIVVAGLAAVFALRRPPVPEWVRQYPQVLLALSGILWIVLLQPQMLGWVLLMLAVIASLRSPFPAARVRAS